MSSEIVSMKEDLIRLHDEITSLTNDLKEGIRDSKLNSVVVFKIPTPDKEEEKQRLIEGAQDRIIEIKTLTGNEALEEAMDAYGRWIARPGQSTRFVTRTPGVIVFDAPDERLHSLVEQINFKKSLFTSRLSPIGSSLERYEIVHQAIPNLITQQLTRNIPNTNVPVRSVGFTWSRRMQCSILNKDQLDEYLADAQNYSRPVPDDSEGLSWFEYIEKFRQHIKNKPNTKLSPFRIRRRLAARPLANIRPTLKSGISPFQLEQHLPALIFNPASGLKIKKLNDYLAPPLRRQNYASEGHYEPFIPSLDVFIKR